MRVMKFGYSSVEKIISVGEGTRVELDFIDVLNRNEGVLVGDKASGFICVLGETRETETYPPRPFRVNAGAIHQYVYVGDDKTKYLSEVKMGDQIVVTDGENERLVSVGRVKIEKRPFKKIFLKNGLSATLQDADSVFIQGKNREIHFKEISGEEEIAYVEEENCARHKGQVIEETIEER